MCNDQYSIQTTLDIYSHVAPGLQEAVAVRFDEDFASKSKSIIQAEEKVI
jgi:hypothetical protein